MITTRNICKNFGKLAALSNISVSLNAGETIAMIGPNGSGKTTLIKTLLGLVIPDKGDILYKGQSVLGQWKYRNSIGYMPQIGRYPDNMRIGQIIDMITDLRKDDNVQVDMELINSLGVNRMLDKAMRTLSGGTRQKVSACLAFMFHPEVLILDEPTAGLDPLSGEILKDKISREKDRGKLIMITSHVLSDLDDLVSEVIFMEEGHVRFHKRVSDLQAETGEVKLNKVMAVLMDPYYDPVMQ
ncbi:MAG: ABC transporter ATP-binding protein [Chitinophagaceae bacterium]|nr:ABC transporter ATP-binding protein [Chitinophagaceae bacterium]